MTCFLSFFWHPYLHCIFLAWRLLPLPVNVKTHEENSLVNCSTCVLPWSRTVSESGVICVVCSNKSFTVKKGLVGLMESRKVNRPNRPVLYQFGSYRTHIDIDLRCELRPTHECPVSYRHLYLVGPVSDNVSCLQP